MGKGRPAATSVTRQPVSTWKGVGQGASGVWLDMKGLGRQIKFLLRRNQVPFQFWPDTSRCWWIAGASVNTLSGTVSQAGILYFEGTARGQCPDSRLETV